MCAHIGEDGSQHTHKEVKPGQHLQRCERPRKCEPAIIIEPRRQEMPSEHQHSELSQQNVAGPLR